MEDKAAKKEVNFHCFYFCMSLYISLRDTMTSSRANISGLPHQDERSVVVTSARIILKCSAYSGPATLSAVAYSPVFFTLYRLNLLLKIFKPPSTCMEDALLFSVTWHSGCIPAWPSPLPQHHWLADLSVPHIPAIQIGSF